MGQDAAGKGVPWRETNTWPHLSSVPILELKLRGGEELLEVSQGRWSLEFRAHQWEGVRRGPGKHPRVPVGPQEQWWTQMTSSHKDGNPACVNSILGSFRWFTPALTPPINKNEPSLGEHSPVLQRVSILFLSIRSSTQWKIDIWNRGDFTKILETSCIKKDPSG